MARLQRIALVVARMAQRSAALLQDVRHLAANLGGVVNVPGDHWDPEAGILTVVQRHGVSLLLDTTTVSPPGQPTRLYTRIRTRAQSKMGAQFVLQGQRVEVQPFDLHQLTLVTDEDPTFSAAFTVFADDPRTCQRQLNASLRRRLLHLKPALLADDHHEVLLWLPGLVLNITSVEEALELVAHVARPRTIPLVH
jgi:hypothetical protein